MWESLPHVINVAGKISRHFSGTDYDDVLRKPFLIKRMHEAISDEGSKLQAQFLRLQEDMASENVT